MDFWHCFFNQLHQFEIPMGIEIKINCPDPEKDLHIPYLTWGPAICHVRVTGNRGDKKLFLRTSNRGKGRAVFTDAGRSKVYPTAILTCTDENWVTFYMAGDFGNASTRDKDIALNVFDVDPSTNPTAAPASSEALMVRVRKDAETLTADERTRFLDAFAKLNRKDNFAFYAQFTQMHIENTDNEIHKYENFLPWHRLYLLNLERDLQKIDPSVSLHYWRWDFPAPNLFSRDFGGEIDVVTDGSGSVPSFALTNPWRQWRPPGSKSLLRSAHNWDLRLNGGYDVLVDRNAPEAYAIAMGNGDYKGLYFVEGRVRGTNYGLVFSKPHGGGHMSFRGLISDISTAPQDPVFFMLHSNVDRLWAVWQNYWNRFSPDDENSYTPQGMSPNREDGFGAYSEETQWPWNGDDKAPRPPQVPYGEYPTVQKGYNVLPKPSPKPKIVEVIDYKGRLEAQNSVGFDYDQIPFHFTAPPSLMRAAMNERQDIQQILDKGLAIDARLAALDSVQFVEDKQDQARLVSLLADRTEVAAVRTKVMFLVAPSMDHSQEFIRTLLSILNDLTEPALVRGGAMDQLRLFSLGGRAFQEFRPMVLEGLRSLVRDQDSHIANEAIDLLAYQKDEWLQRQLKDGLEDPSKALVSAFAAVHYLSLDPHDFLDVFKKVALQAGEEQAQLLAIRALASDTDASDFLLELFKNKDASTEVREASAHALDAQDPDLFMEKSLETLKDDDEADHQLHTVLLSKLTLADEDDLGKIRKDTELLAKLSARAARPSGLRSMAPGVAMPPDDFQVLLGRLNARLDNADE